MKRNPGWTHKTIADMTDDQILHSLGFDLDELYGMQPESEWFKFFDRAVERLGIKPKQILLWPKDWLIKSMAEHEEKKLERGMTIIMLYKYVVEHQ